MTASQNGWRANDRSVIATYPLPGGFVALREGSPGECLVEVAKRYHATIEPLVWPGVWGYAERAIRGGTVLSNHASGTAIDLNAPAHPLGTDPASNFTVTQLAAVRKIANAGILHGVRLIRWGGDYVGRKDGMHWEVNDGVTQAQLDELLPVLRKLNEPPPTIVWGKVVDAAPGTRVIGLGSQGPNDVAVVQRWHGLAADGAFGFATEAAVKATQARNGLTADGIVGPATWHTLGFR